MIRIIDRTLSCLDDYNMNKEQVIKLISLLIHCDVDCIELSEKVLRILGDLPPFGSYILRINDLASADKYMFIDKFICNNFYDEEKRVYADLFINDVNDNRLLMLHQTDKILRITGLGNLFKGHVQSSILHLKKILSTKVEFCASNEFGCGTAIVTEWINSKCGNAIVTSFGGIGGFAPFEEVLISLRHLFRRHPQTNYDSLPHIKNLVSEITGMEFGICAPVIGTGIFTVESGIHIGGILKHPKCYEPFPPEAVGGERVFTYGKFSGKAGIKYKLKELCIDVTDEEANIITQKVKENAELMGSSVSDAILLEIVSEVKGGGL